MNIEYHYYIIYLIAIASGFEMHEAYKIAYSSQYVDDNYDEYDIYSNVEKNKHIYRNLVSGINIREMFVSMGKEMKKTLTIFHLLPGDKEVNNNRRDDKEHSLKTTKNSELANIILEQALNSKNLYWIGVASHAYADSWAHQNFVGTLSDFNAFPEEVLSPNIAHCDAFDKPDLVGLIWEDTRLKRKKVNNVDRFLDASEKLINWYGKYTNNQHLDINGGLSELKKIMMNNGKNSYFDVKRLENNRIKQYDNLAKKLTSFDILRYDKNKWYNETIKSSSNGKLHWKDKKYTNSDWYQFQEAVKLHYKSVKSDIASRQIDL